MAPVDPRLNLSLDGAGDSRDGVSREASEAVMAAGSNEGLDEGFEVSEVLKESGETSVLGEEGSVFGLELEQSFDGG